MTAIIKKKKNLNENLKIWTNAQFQKKALVQENIANSLEKRRKIIILSESRHALV